MSFCSSGLLFLSPSVSSCLPPTVFVCLSVMVHLSPPQCCCLVASTQQHMPRAVCVATASCVRCLSLSLLAGLEYLVITFRYAHPKETDEFGGLASRRAAFSDRGKYGSLLLSLPPAFKVNGIVFSHAGVSPQFASLGLRATQKLLREELKDGCSLYYKKHMGMGGSGPFAGGEDGPLWTRLYTLSPPAVSCPALEKALKLLQADLMVVGHTVQESLSVQAFCGGRLLAIDTGISRYVANSPRAIEITPEGVVHEVSVHSSLEAADEENSPPPKRRLLVQPLTFYTQKRSSNKHNPANAAAKAAAAYKREYYLQETMALDEL